MFKHSSICSAFMYLHSNPNIGLPLCLFIFPSYIPMQCRGDNRSIIPSLAWAGFAVAAVEVKVEVVVVVEVERLRSASAPYNDNGSDTTMVVSACGVWRLTWWPVDAWSESSVVVRGMHIVA